MTSNLQQRVWPEGVRLTIHAGPDSIGRYSYTVEWPAEYTPGHPAGEHVPRSMGQCFHALLPLWATRPIYGRDVSFDEWLRGRGIDPASLPGEGEEARFIVETALSRQRTRREARSYNALVRRIQQKHALWTAYKDEVPERVVGRRPLNLDRADDRAYVRVQRRRAEARRGQHQTEGVARAD